MVFKFKIFDFSLVKNGFFDQNYKILARFWPKNGHCSYGAEVILFKWFTVNDETIFV